MLMHTLNIMYTGTSLTNVHSDLHANNRATCKMPPAAAATWQDS